MEFLNTLIFFVENGYKKGFSKFVFYVIIFTNKSFRSLYGLIRIYFKNRICL